MNPLNDPLVSVTKEFTILVDDVNEAPTFHVPQRIVGFEDIPFEHIVVVGVTEGPFEEFQNIIFNVTVDNPSMFQELPSIRRQESEGILKFVPQRDVFGRTLANITLMDDGGTAFGGVNVFTMSTYIEIFPVNEAPVVNFVDDIFVFENVQISVICSARCKTCLPLAVLIGR